MIALRLLLLALTVAALAAAEGLPEDISARLDGYEAACQQLDAKGAEKLDKERQALAKTLKRIIERERKAGHTDSADVVQQKLDALAPEAKTGGAAPAK